MLEKKTLIDQIEIARDGAIQVRLAIVVLDGETEVSSRWHRTTIPPGVDPQATLDAVNSHITQHPTLRAAPVDTARLPQLKAVCSLVHTKECVEAHRKRVLAAQEPTLQAKAPT